MGSREPGLPASGIVGWQRATTPEDLVQLYRAFLGREAEEGVLGQAGPRPLHEVVVEMAASDEINSQVLHALVHQRKLPHARLSDSQLQALDAWLAGGLGCPEADGDEPCVASVLTRLFRHPAVAALLLHAHGSLYSQAMDDLALLRRAGRSSLQGKIEFANREHISGWALDEAGLLTNLQLEVRLREDGRLVARASAHSHRPDIQRRFGGDGLAGFRARWDPRRLPASRSLELTLHEAATGAPIGPPYRFENSFVDQLTVAQMLAHEFEAIRQRLDVLAGMVPQALSYCAYPLEHYHHYRRTHHVPPPPQLGAEASAHFSVLVDMAGAGPDALRPTVESLRAQQAIPRWRALIAGARGPVADAAQALAAADPRLQVVESWHEVQRILGMTTEPAHWVVLLQGGELLDSQALGWFAQAAADDQAVAAYADEDCLLDEGHARPVLRSRFDPDSLLEMNVVGECLAVQAGALLAAAARLGDADESIHPFERRQRERLVWALQSQGSLRHVAQPLLTRSAHAIEPPGRLLASTAPRDLQGLLPPAWQGHPWERVPDPLAPSLGKALVRWQPRRPDAVLSVLIPTRDQVDLLRNCVESLRRHARSVDGGLEILVADNGSTQADTLDYLQAQQRAGHLRVLRVDEPFNWSRLNNLMVREARGEHLLFLNNDTVMLTPQWDDALRGLLERSDIGAVGARLLYEDMTVQHAGVQFGYEDFVGHVAVGQPADSPDDPPLSQLTREVSAITGAFIACRRSVFEHVAPFDEQALGVTFNDVDWCVRLRRQGLKILYAPLLSLIHHESKSRGFDFMSPHKQSRAQAERRVLLARWPDAFRHDPFMSPRLSGWAHDGTYLR